MRFAPMNLVSQFAKQYSDLTDAQLRADFFTSQVDLLLRTCDANNRSLILRDHSHPDYMRARPRHGSALLSHLDGYDLKSVVTIRDPVDSYLSCVRRKWLKAIDSDFGRYCDRILKFINDFEGSPVYRYEDFCVDPTATMREMCASLDLKFAEDFLDKFSEIELTGDSGRTSATISLPPRREIDPEIAKGLIEAASNSPNYQILCERFGYQSICG